MSEDNRRTGFVLLQAGQIIGGLLNEFDKEDWWDVAQEANPSYTREQYEKDWAEFQAMKAKKKLQ